MTPTPPTERLAAHLYFNELNTSNQKTRKWEVTANASDEILGHVSFWGAWRKYVFKPLAATLYDASCLREIADFTETQTATWRAEVRERNNAK
jgi:hypothetical protein